jgi:hypothetical protein
MYFFPHVRFTPFHLRQKEETDLDAVPQLNEPGDGERLNMQEAAANKKKKNSNRGE